MFFLKLNKIIKYYKEKGKGIDMKVTKEFVLFCGSEFSQWYKSEFKDENGVTYITCEQFMMAHKALLFKDKKAYDLIMKTSNPKKCKEYGREVENFDKEIWDEYAKLIVYVGNYYKYTQNEELKNLMYKYEDKEFVEAAHYDKIWGIGLRETDKRCLDKNLWKGTNWLGECLTEVKEDIINNSIVNFEKRSEKLSQLSFD